MNEKSCLVLNGIILIGLQSEHSGAVVVRPGGQEVEGDLLAVRHRQTSQQSQGDFRDLAEDIIEHFYSPRVSGRKCILRYNQIPRTIW